MTNVTYPTTGTHSYTYDLVSFNVNLPPTHVIKTKTGDGGTWTYTYEPSTGYIPEGQTLVTCSDTTLDRTTVVGPDGTRKYCHFGYNSSTGGLLYAIGARAQTVTTDPIKGVVLREGSSHQPAVITTRQKLVRPGNSLIESAQVSAPQVTSQATQRDSLDHTIEYSGFDAYGNPGSVVETGTNVRKTAQTYFINAGKWITSIPKDETIEVDGAAVGVITRSFDSNGNRLDETKFGVKSSWTYYPTGDVQTYTDPRSKVITYKDYYRGTARLEEQPEGVTISRVIDDRGNLQSQKDGELNETAYIYDDLNRIKTVTPPFGNAINVFWDSPNLKRVVRGGATATMEFDPFGRLITDKVAGGAYGDGAKVAYKYDAVGRRVWVSDPGNPEVSAPATGTQTEYDVLGRTVAVKLACASFNGACEAQRLTQYGGSVIVDTDENKNQTRYDFRTFGHPDSKDLMKLSPSDSSLNVVYERNGLGQITSATQAGLARTHHYNAKYFLDESVEPETGKTLYGRDEAGNMTSRQVGASAVTTYVYDDLGRLKNINYPVGTDSVARSYYRTSKLKQVTAGATSRTLVYDGNGNTKTETLTVDGKSFVTTYDCDSNEGISTITYGSGNVISYAPGPLARPTQAIPFVSSLTRHPSGVLRNVTYANGTYETVELNTRLLPKSLELRPGGSSSPAAPYIQSAYTYTPDGAPWKVTDGVFDKFYREFGYDNVNRLRVAYGSWGRGSMDYDARGNFTVQSVVGQKLTYGYDTTVNRLTSLSGLSPTRVYTYDVYGGITGDGTRTYKYNDAQQVTCAKCGTTGEVQYAYDGLGHRVKSTPTAGGVTTYSIYDSAGTLLWETVPGQWTKEYAYLDGKQVGVRELALGTGAGGGATSLVMSLTATNAAPPKGTVITVNPKVFNNGTMTAQSVSVVTAIAPGMEFVSAGTGCTTNSGKVVCSISSLTANTTKTFDFQLRAAVSGPVALTSGVNTTTALLNTDTSSATLNVTVAP
jgi:hypothetical protein